MSRYLVLLANELLGAKGAGYFDLDTLIRLEKITDLAPDDWEDWEWPSSDRSLGYYYTTL